MKKIGFIDYYLDEYHANNYPGWIKELSGGKLEVTYAWAKNDSPSGMTTRQWCDKNSIAQLASIEEVVEQSDCLVVLSPDHPEMHEELCALPLASGKLVYVDKTFAPDRAAALRIFENAEKHNTPCFTTSALRFAPEYQPVDKAKVQNIASWGPGSLSIYSIHQIEPIISLMGAGAKRVLFTGTEQWPALVIEFADGRRASLAHHGWSCPFTMSVGYTDATSEMIKVESDFYHAFLTQMVDFFLTGDVKVSHEETIAVISTREAGITASHNPGNWVTIL